MNNQRLTANEARKLDKMLRFTENILSQRDIPHSTNALDIHTKVWLTICFHTENFLQETVYSVPGVIPPIN